jgi:hypothetical protein
MVVIPIAHDAMRASREIASALPARWACEQFFFLLGWQGLHFESGAMASGPCPDLRDVLCYVELAILRALVRVCCLAHEGLVLARDRI